MFPVIGNDNPIFGDHPKDYRGESPFLDQAELGVQTFLPLLNCHFFNVMGNGPSFCPPNLAYEHPCISVHLSYKNWTTFFPSSEGSGFKTTIPDKLGISAPSNGMLFHCHIHLH